METYLSCKQTQKVYNFSCIYAQNEMCLNKLLQTWAASNKPTMILAAEIQTDRLYRFPVCNAVHVWFFVMCFF